MRALVGCLLLWSTLTLAQDSTCESKCNQAGSDCLKACSGDPKDVNKPGASKKMMDCLKKCEKETKPCRDACKKPKR